MASKKGPLSKAEVFYITEHAKLGKEIGEVAQDLDRPIKSVEKCYTQAKIDNEKPLTAGEQFAKHKGSVIMTQNASTLSDSRRKSRSSPKSKNCITSIKKV